MKHTRRIFFNCFACVAIKKKALFVAVSATMTLCRVPVYLGRSFKNIKSTNHIKKYNIMRKYFVEKYSFYKLLDDLNSLPYGACATPLYYNKRFDFIDVYVIFMQDEISPPDKPDDPKKTQIGAFFLS